MTRILWVSRHQPLPAQLSDLRAAFGPSVSISIDPTPYNGPDDVEGIVSRFRRSGCDELAVIATRGSYVIEGLLQRGVRPLRPVMDALAGRPTRVDPRIHVEAQCRWYVYQGFERVKGVRWDVDELRPAPALCPDCYAEEGEEVAWVDDVCPVCGLGRYPGGRDDRSPEPPRPKKKGTHPALYWPLTAPSGQRVFGRIRVTWGDGWVVGYIDGYEVWRKTAEVGDLLELRGADPASAKVRIRPGQAHVVRHKPRRNG